MARKSSARTVQCYLCDHVFEIPEGAMTTSCPACFKRVVIEDIVVRHAQGNTVLGTCGRLVVQPRASVVARRIRAIQGVEIQGTIESAVETEGEVHLTPTAKWKGDCTARSLVVEPGATISGGFFSIGGPRPARGTRAEDEADAELETKPAEPVEPVEPVEPASPRRSAGTSSTRARPAATRAAASPERDRSGPSTRKAEKSAEPPKPAPARSSPSSGPRAKPRPPTAKPRKPGGAATGE